VHLWPGRTEPLPVRWVRQTYLVLIPALIGLLFLHNAGDWVRKCLRLRSGAPQGASPLHTGIRMYSFERVQHASLMVSFLVLAWSGLLLKYPDQWWVRPFAWLGEAARGTLHRGAAVVFIAAALAHLVSLAASPTLRGHWKELWPRREDAVQGVRMFAYNLGLTSVRPPLSRYSYIEKLEYWAVVWGFALMTSTGLLLWANSLVLSRLPKIVLDVATALHFYEALLACLAVAVWHFYVVIFDPDVYPMNPCWITGSHRAPEEETEVADTSPQPVVRG
jgi:cytochrome b subunit of formate dehydrogenase